MNHALNDTDEVILDLVRGAGMVTRQYMDEITNKNMSATRFYASMRRLEAFGLVQRISTTNGRNRKTAAWVPA